MYSPIHLSARRDFLRFLMASPILATAQEGLPPIESAKDALNIMEFEPLARKAMPPAHWGYLTMGVNDDLTVRMNREAMDHYQLRVRVLNGVAKADLKTEVFGQQWDVPFYASAVASQKAFHPEGETGLARALKAHKTAQMLSTNSSTSVEDVATALGTPPWFQLYMPVQWSETEKLIRRVEAAGCPVVAWTVDSLKGRNAETGTRWARLDTRNCVSCHATHPIKGPAPNTLPARNRTKPMYAGLNGATNPAEADWTYLDRLKKLTRMKVVLKGIDTAEDALLAVEHGADGLVVSNHGGRATETGRGTMDILPEVVDAVNGKIPVFVDGGFRRGTDVFKALAIGAKAVGIGRPCIWGLAAFGQEGAERILELMRAELTLTMRQCGVPSIAKISRASILRNGVKL
jgi:4-hydroxymandelate oxidase